MSSGSKTALITGSGQNIGRGIANQLALAGFNIIVNGSRNQDAAEAVAAEVRAHGVEALVAMGNVGIKAEAEALAKAGLDHFGKIDVLVNNAAIRPHGPFLDMNDDEWQKVMDVDLNAAIWLSRVILPGMIDNGWGRILSFSGMNAQRGYPGASAVSVAKHAGWGLTTAFAGGVGITGLPGKRHAPSHFPPHDAARANDQQVSALPQVHPTRRLGRTEDIGAMVVYLCSKNGGFVNGQMLQINGGVVMQF